jgi:hypothetical protein
MTSERPFRKGCRVEDVVSHRTGTVVFVSEDMLGVKWDDSGISLPAHAEDLRKLREDKRP